MFSSLLRHKQAESRRERIARAEEEHSFRQERRGRPGPDTKYRRITKQRWKITWQVDEEAIAYDHQCDGMYPLLSNDRSLTPRQVLEAHQRQPLIENRFKQTKTVHEIAPVLLKNQGRIEALFFLYFVALLVTALLERELHRAMARKEIEERPLYPEERKTKRPTAEQVLRLFSLLERHRLYQAEKKMQVFSPDLTELQTQVLTLLGVPPSVYR